MGIPCYLDRLSPTEEYWPSDARYRKRPFDFGKIWWSMHMAELGWDLLPNHDDILNADGRRQSQGAHARFTLNVSSTLMLKLYAP
jgi:hypothetical protein